MPLTNTNSKFPRLKLNKLKTTRDLMKYINQRSGFHAREATPIRLEGLGIFSPSIKLDGTYNIKFRPDKSLIKDLNRENYLKPYITNRKNVGKTLTEIEASSD